MIHIIPSEDRYHADMGWLSTHWHFSFDHYYDPANMRWGALRVFNDDVIQPGQGFGMHPHRDMEIITYVLQGELEHRDTLGNTGVIRPGEVQVMSAGSGITHSEYNHSKEYTVHLLQLWVLPRTKGLKPRWEQRQFPSEDRRGKLLPVVSSGEIPDTLRIDQDAAIYVADLAPGHDVVHRSRDARKAYLFAISGGLVLNDQPVNEGGQARIDSEPELRIQAEADSRLILLDLPA